MHTITAILSCTWLLLLASAHAAEAGHDHQRLVTDPGLTLAELVTRTVARAPSIGELASQAELAAAWDARASNWLSASPALSLRYQTDRFNRKDGLREYEAGLALPLWRLGEKSATAAFAGSLDREAATARMQLRWEVAGAVRRVLWRVADAEIDHAIAMRSADIVGSLMAKVERAQELGDVAVGDVLIARSSHLRAVNVMIEKEAALLDAEREFVILTQDSIRPEFSAETISKLTDIPADHVMISWLNSQVSRASAARDRIEKSSRGNPSLLLGPKREQGPNEPEHYNSFGVTLNLPFATGTHAGPEIAAAERVLAGVIADRDRELRRLKLMFHEAAHEMMVVNEQLAAADESAALAKRQIEMGDRAFEAGELNLLNLLQIQDTALTAEREVALLGVARSRAIARYNQAVGDTP